jgi:hypothetical protein
MEKNEKYPEEISSNDKIIENYEIVDISEDSYKAEFERADEIAKNTGGEVYTMIDSDGDEILYWKGKHLVNRIGVCVLRL